MKSNSVKGSKAGRAGGLLSMLLVLTFVVILITQTSGAPSSAAAEPTKFPEPTRTVGAKTPPPPPNRPTVQVVSEPNQIKVSTTAASVSVPITKTVTPPVPANPNH